MDEINRITIEIGNKLMREGEIFYTRDISDIIRIRLIRYLNEIYKVSMKKGIVYMIEHWDSKNWFVWKRVV